MQKKCKSQKLVEKISMHVMWSSITIYILFYNIHLFKNSISKTLKNNTYEYICRYISELNWIKMNSSQELERLFLQGSKSIKYKVSFKCSKGEGPVSILLHFITPTLLCLKSVTLFLLRASHESSYECVYYNEHIIPFFCNLAVLPGTKYTECVLDYHTAHTN